MPSRSKSPRLDAGLGVGRELAEEIIKPLAGILIIIIYICIRVKRKAESVKIQELGRKEG